MKLNLDDLLGLAEMNQELSSDVFRRKYSDRRISITDFEHVKEKPKLSIDDAVIVIEDFEMSLNVLKFFGKHILNLNLISNGTNQTNFHKLLNAANEYCSESLIEFGLQLDQPVALPPMLKPFKNVKRVSIKNEMPLIDSDAHQMNETFPALRALSVSGWAADTDYVNCHFAQLFQLSAETRDEHLIADLVFQNPQIRSISVESGSLDLLLIIKETLLNLEHLSIGWFDVHNKEIHFDNVTKFTMEMTADAPDNFYFPHLQELEIYYHSNFINEWIHFAESHRQLSRFHLKYWSMDDDQFEKLTLHLPNLVEMSVTSLKGNAIGTNAISRFIESHSKLARFDVDMCRDAEKRTLRTKFEKKWKIQDYRQCASFQRKY